MTLSRVMQMVCGRSGIQFWSITVLESVTRQSSQLDKRKSPLHAAFLNGIPAFRYFNCSYHISILSNVQLLTFYNIYYITLLSQFFTCVHLSIYLFLEIFLSKLQISAYFTKAFIYIINKCSFLLVPNTMTLWSILTRKTHSFQNYFNSVKLLDNNLYHLIFLTF